MAPGATPQGVSVPETVCVCLHGFCLYFFFPEIPSVVFSNPEQLPLFLLPHHLPVSWAIGRLPSLHSLLSTFSLCHVTSVLVLYYFRSVSVGSFACNFLEQRPCIVFHVTPLAIALSTEKGKHLLDWHVCYQN